MAYAGDVNIAIGIQNHGPSQVSIVGQPIIPPNPSGVAVRKIFDGGVIVAGGAVKAGAGDVNVAAVVNGDGDD